MRVCVCVCVCVRACVRVRVYVLRIVSMDKILRFTNTLFNSMVKKTNNTTRQSSSSKIVDSI